MTKTNSVPQWLRLFSLVAVLLTFTLTQKSYANEQGAQQLAQQRIQTQERQSEEFVTPNTSDDPYPNRFCRSECYRRLDHCRYYCSYSHHHNRWACYRNCYERYNWCLSRCHH